MNMKPVKIKVSRGECTVRGKNSASNSLLNQRIKEKTEKENKTSKQCIVNEKKAKKRSSVLLDSPIPSKRANKKKFKIQPSFDDTNDSDDDDLDLDLDEVFHNLKKIGVKTVQSNSNCSKKSPASLSAKSERNTSKKQTKNDDSKSTSLDKKKIVNVIDELKNSLKSKKKYVKNEKEIPELEKLSEDVLCNYNKTPVKSIHSVNEETPKKHTSNETTLRRSTRKKSSVFNDNIVNYLEKTPSKKSIKTPNKKFSLNKPETVEPKTPTLKHEKKLPTTPLEKARLSLHVSTVPDGLPCREKEFSNILTFLENKLWDGIGGCMYISGVPGTGKTATVNQVIKHLQDLSNRGKAPDFTFIEINGMRLSDPRQAYVQLWQKLFDRKEKIAWDRAQKHLDDWFSKSDRKNSKKTTVLLVDELDLICTKKQDVVYNLLDWPTRTHSRLVVLTIANTMDMPERLFKGRVTSRMGLTRLTFMPYTHKQLEEIVLARLKGLDAFVTDAVRLVTRKVAAVSGDARRALDICRRATELPPPDETVKICHIEQAIKEMTNSNIVKVLRSRGEMEKLFLRSLSDVSFRSNLEEVDLREVIDQLLAICVLEGISQPSISSILSVSHRLKCSRLIFTNQSSAGILQRLTLNVTQDDIHYALRG